MTPRRGALARVRDLPATSARIRLTLVMAVGLAVAGASILTTVLVVMRLLPTPAVTPTLDADTDADTDGDGGGDVGLAPAPDAVPTGVDGGGEGALELPPGVSVELVALRTTDELLGQLLATSAVVLAVVLVLGTATSWWLAGRVLRPVDRLTAAAREIDHGGLSPALDLGDRRDEFGRLADTLRETMWRLDRSYQAQRRFAANASHELRTPLATTQAMLDVALADPGAVDVALLAGRLREVNARSVRTVSALLALADAQSGDRDDAPVDLAPLVAATVDACSADAVRRAPEAHPTVTTDLAPAVVHGDAALLEVLVGNLVSNALRHGRPDGLVHVSLAGPGEVVGTRADDAPAAGTRPAGTRPAATLVVENEGDELDPAEVASFTEPFWRRAGRVAGSHGLGLALVAAVAEAHDARLELRPRRGGGLVATVTF